MAKIDILQIYLEESRIEAFIPRAVMNEALDIEKQETPLIAALIKNKKIRVRRVKRNRVISRLMTDFSLHRGEAEAVHLAFELRAVVATDDRNAMRLCRLLDVPFITALAALVRLSEKGILESNQAMAKLERLGRVGRYRQELLLQARKQIQGD